MKTNTGMVSGVILVVIVLGYYGYLLFDAMAAGNEVPSGTTLAEVPTLDQDALADIRNKNVNGNLPIKLGADDLKNTAPFLTR